MTRVRGAGVMIWGLLALADVSCTNIPTSDNAVLSVAIDSLPAPAVVLGDTLRDSTGRAVPIHATAYNFKGVVIANAPERFHALDPGLRVDSITGFATADSLRLTPARILITIGALQAIQTLDVTLRPDTVSAVNARDSLLYSLLDTTKNVSPGLAVRVLHSLTSADSAVKSYLVSFAIVSPADTLLASLVNDGGNASRVDTTDTSGMASRRIRLDPVRLKSLTDSIVVQATVKYRGAQVRGSPVKIVLKVKPAS